MLAIVLPVLLSAAVIVASAKVVARNNARGPEQALVAQAKTPYELRFMNQQPEDSFVSHNGPAAPELPVDTAAMASTPQALTQQNWRATQTPGDPASDAWALLIGINDYQCCTRDNIGSYQDVVALRQYLLSLGWQADHIGVIANLNATRQNILNGLQWLSEKTDGGSLVVFNYSGHEEPCGYDSDHDGDNDICLWAADNRFIASPIMGGALGKVRDKRMWINYAVCRARGFNDAGTEQPGRVVTYAAPASELAYEDPDVHHSVLGEYEIMEGLIQGKADSNHDGLVSVQEAFTYALPRVLKRTDDLQHPSMWDGFHTPFYLSPSAA
jgi:hypothetical protein